MDTEQNDSIVDTARRVGKAGAAFDATRRDFPPQTAAYSSLLEVYASANAREPGKPCGGALLIAPYGCGKTVALEMLRDTLLADAEPGKMPVVLVQMAASGTVDALPTSILKAMNIPRPEAGNEKSRWARAILELQRKKVDLVVFDEFNRASRRPTMTGPIGKSIQEHVMDPGVAAVAFVGSDEASIVFKACPELQQRLDDHIDLAPLDPLIDEDMDDLTTFLGELDQALAEPGLLGCRSLLDNAETATKLCLAGNGRLRAIMKIIRTAMLSVVRRGGDMIEAEDLFNATDLLSVRPGHVELNPFADSTSTGG
jgi:hypothetical protein